jgi:hypothetical protein
MTGQRGHRIKPERPSEYHREQYDMPLELAHLQHNNADFAVMRQIAASEDATFTGLFLRNGPITRHVECARQPRARQLLKGEMTS